MIKNTISKIKIKKLPVEKKLLVEILLRTPSSCTPADLQVFVIKTCDKFELELELLSLSIDFDLLGHLRRTVRSSLINFLLSWKS